MWYRLYVDLADLLEAKTGLSPLHLPEGDVALVHDAHVTQTRAHLAAPVDGAYSTTEMQFRSQFS